jgi:peptidoglycan/LPS O-acetylase OafA/YrhL
MAVAVVDQAGGRGSVVADGRRPALDGLRAVAVTLVVLFHCSVDVVEGGFVGVDVFFVLSGYLVTGVILRGWERQGRTRFARFYSRRFRRLLPASVATLLATVVVFRALVSPIEMLSIERAARASLLYVANWFFIGESTDYFADDVSRNPLLHMWSLAVEEQFYLVWPLLLTGLLVVGRRLGRDPRRVAALVVAGGAVVSAGAALALRSSNPNRAYFGTDTRAYQLLAGALLALVPAVIARAGRRPRPAGGAALLGLAAVCVVSLSVVDVDPIVRGVLTTVATAGVIIGLEAAPRGLLARGLSVDPVVHLGQISYGTYLWHWPVVIALDELIDVGTPARVAVVLVVSNALASLSFRMLEMPVRTSRALDRLPGATIVGAGLAVSVVAALVLVPRLADGGAAARSDPTAAPTTGLTPIPSDLDVVAVKDDGYGVAATCDDGPVEDCTMVEGSGTHVLLMGDSNAEMMVPAFVAMAEQEGTTLSVAINSGCPWQREVYVLGPVIREDCRRIKTDAYERVIPALDPDVVVTIDSMPATGYGTDPEGDERRHLRDATVASVEELGDGGRRAVVLLEPIPTTPWSSRFDPLACLGESTYVEECRFTDATRPSWYRTLLRDLDDEGPTVSTMDLRRLVCPLAPTCDPVVDGQVVFWNSRHVTAAWSESMGSPLAVLFRAEGLLDRH